MKTTLFFLLISLTAFSQSKKELRVEIDLLKSQQAQLNLAHQIQVDQLTKKVDSLNRVITRQTNQSQLDHSTIVRLREELDTTTDSLNRVNSLLTSKQAKKKEEKTKAVTPVTIKKDDPFVNPFGSGGSGNGSGMTYGSNGSGTGSGPGAGGRTRLNNVSINHIECEQDATIYFKLTIDENGDVLSASVTSKTTTTDQQLINQVKAAVIQQVKFSKSPGAEPTIMFYTVKIDGN
jgi:hypothetical protein